MNDYIEQRTIEVAKYMIKTGETVRKTGKVFGISRNTVHHDVTERLQKINPYLAKKVREVLNKNKSLRHIRGGEQTKLKYKKQKGA